MAKKADLSDDDKNIFRQAMRGVKPLKSLSKSKRAKLPGVPLKRRPVEPETIPDIPFSDYEKLPSVNSDEKLEYSRDGIPNKKLRNLRQGQYNVGAILDLHGLTVVEAKTALSHFLYRCQQDDVTIALINHGKGKYSDKPVLKNKLNLWLRQIEQVLAFCSVRHGGALFVLLKRQRRNT